MAKWIIKYGTPKKEMRMITKDYNMAKRKFRKKHPRTKIHIIKLAPFGLRRRRRK